MESELKLYINRSEFVDGIESFVDYTIELQPSRDPENIMEEKTASLVELKTLKGLKEDEYKERIFALCGMPHLTTCAGYPKFGYFVCGDVRATVGRLTR